MKYYVFLLILWLIPVRFYAQQDTLKLTLTKTIELARKQSPQAVSARHQYRAMYWNWRSFKADYLPSLSFNSSSSLNRSISSITLPDGSDSFVHRNQLLNDNSLTINQNIAPLGGSIYMKTGLQRLDILSDKIISYKSTPIVLGYSQNLLGYNHLKWNRKIEPIRYTQAQKEFRETLELVAATASSKFFKLAMAQSNWESASYNYATADTLYRYAQGRYKIGTITENEMLQLEINYLTEQTNKMNARIEMDDYIQDLRSFLGITEQTKIVVEIASNLPEFLVSEQEALTLARQNSPEIENFKLRKLESESSVAKARSSRGMKADLYLEFGLTQTHKELKGAYHSPLDQQLVSLGIRIPILDWGVGKGRVEVAKSNYEKTLTDIKQAQTDFDANIVKLVKQFNLQANKVHIAQKTSERAKKRNEVAYRLYLLGKSNILDLNSAVAEKDRLQRSFILELQNYWSMYYTLRSITGWDFQKNTEIPLEKPMINNSYNDF